MNQPKEVLKAILQGKALINIPNVERQEMFDEIYYGMLNVFNRLSPKAFVWASFGGFVIYDPKCPSWTTTNVNMDNLPIYQLNEVEAILYHIETLASAPDYPPIPMAR